jgi:hypothetical protein
VTVSKSGQKTNNRPVSKLSDTLFGKNLLSQISSLVISFLSLSLAQMKVVIPGHAACTVLGNLKHFYSQFGDGELIFKIRTTDSAFRENLVQFE